MGSPKNIKEFQALVKRYETISLNEIEENWDEEYPVNTAKQLTGYGSNSTCSLCKVINASAWGYECDDCVYGYSYGCVNLDNEKSYIAILNAKTPIGLLRAFRKRAKHLRKNYSQYL